ncbi:MAG: tetratricopeptide repeat protein [Myxococcota bacterium]
MNTEIQGYAFGPFKVFLSPRQLLRDDHVLRAQPLVIELLLCGLRHPGEVLPRETLLQTLRSETTLSDHSLSQLVYKLRKILREHKRWWRSVHGHGYCFDGPATALTEPSPPSPTSVPTPAAPAAPTIPNNLPQPQSSFVGRQEELRALSALLHADERLITITGTGGLGKSRLALELARQQLTAAATRWAGGIWFVSLVEGRTDADICSLVARALGIPVGQAAEGLLWSLQDRGPTLLILDNFEQIVDHAAQTVGRWLQEVATLWCVVTSRQRLALSGEQLFPLKLLHKTDAMVLFEARARLVRSTFSLQTNNRDDVAALVEMLDRLPLAIELAASRCRMLSPRLLIDRVSRRFALLKGKVRDLPERHQTLLATLEWSWEMLDETMRAVLCQCSIFEGGMSLEAAAAVIDVPLGADGERLWVEDVLAELLDRSLLQSHDDAGEQGRLSMLLSIQDFARSKREAHLPDTDALARRHGAFFARLAAAQLRQTQNAELDNCKTAAHRLLALRPSHPCDLDDAVRCAQAAARVLLKVGPIDEGAAWMISLARHDAFTPKHRVKLLIGASWLSLDGKDMAQTEALLTEAQTLLGDQRDPAVLNLLGMVWQQQGRSAEAEACFTEALPIARASGARREESLILGNLALSRRRVGDMEEAERLYQQSLAITRALGERETEIRSLNNLGILYQRQGRLDEAEACYQTALDCARALGIRSGECIMLGNLSNLRLLKGDLAYSEATWQEAIRIAREIGDRRRLSQLLSNLGTFLSRQGRIAEAAENIEQALAIVEASGLSAAKPQLLCMLGSLDWYSNRSAEAEATWKEGLALARDVGRPLVEMNLLGNMCELYLKHARYAEAEAQTRAGLALARKHREHRWEAIMLRLYGELSARQEKRTQARALYEEAEQTLGPGRYPRQRFVLFCARAELEVAAERHDVARQYIDAAASIWDTNPVMRSSLPIERLRRLQNPDGGP